MEWKTIETAPRDGRSILCFWPDMDADGDVGVRGDPIVGVARWISPGSGFAVHFCYEGRWTPYDPTHWMPMPEPPNA